MAVPTPESTVTLILDSLLKVVTYLISYLPLAIILVIAGAAIYYWFFERKTKNIDRVELLKKKHMELCKSMKETSYPYMKDLYLLPIDLDKLEGQDKEVIEANLRARNGIYLGEITGFNIINNRSSARELERLNKKGIHTINKDQAAELKEESKAIHEKAGDSFYFIRYKQNISGGFLSPKKIENLLILTSNQMMNYVDQITGNVLVRGYGIEPLGVFNILSGSPRTIQSIITHIKIMTETDTTIGVMGDFRNIVMKAIDLDSTPEKMTRTLSGLGQSIMPRRRKDE